MHSSFVVPYRSNNSPRYFDISLDFKMTRFSIPRMIDFLTAPHRPNRVISPHDIDGNAKMVELVQSYPELCSCIERFASKPLDLDIGVQADDFPVRRYIGEHKIGIYFLCILRQVTWERNDCSYLSPMELNK